MTIKLLAFAGSTRKGSFNKHMISHAVKIARGKGAIVSHISLADYTLPLYDGDLEKEHGIPQKAHELRAIMKTQHGFLIASPEYNSSISGVLKNTIDWVSRPVEGEPSLVAFKNKVVSLMSASPGRLGGMRGLVTLRSILSNIGCIVLPNQYSLNSAHQKFSQEGHLIDDDDDEKITDIVTDLMATSALFANH
jgi:chromate reductase, NAD(P)H dehydrogenase (quinone)